MNGVPSLHRITIWIENKKEFENSWQVLLLSLIHIFRKPYEGEKTYCGYPAHTQEETDRWVETAVEKGYQLLAHCKGDAASGQYLAAFEKAAAKTPENPEKIRALRPVMIHCQTVGDDQLDEMKELGMIPSIFVAHTWYWGDVHLKNLGSVRGAHISPARAAMELSLIHI